MTEIIDGVPQPVNVGDKYVKATWFDTAASGTVSGTITKPAGNKPEVAFIMDEWGSDTDALVSKISGGKPTFKSPVDASGNTITTTFNLAGEYSFSGTPSPAGDHAVIYVYKCYLKHFNVAEALFESESIDFEVSGSIATHAAIQATASVQGHATAVQITKLDAIEALADVTDAVNIASSIVGVVDKSALIDADSIALIDSEAANVLKETTWTSIKAFLKTYFDTLYNLYVHPNHSGEVTSSADGAQTITNKQTMSATAPITLSNTPTVVAGAAPVIAIPAATNAAAGHATAAHIQAIEANTAAKHTQNTDTSLGSGCVALDHGTAATDMVVNVAYGTGDPPAANTVTEGALYIKYVA